MTHRIDVRIQAIEGDRGAETSRKLIVHRAAYPAVRALQLMPDHEFFFMMLTAAYVNSRAPPTP